MRTLSFTLSILILTLTLCGCSMYDDSLTERFPNLVQVNPPGDLPYEESSVNIEKVDVVVLKNGKALHIQGQFPNPCTHLLRVEGELAGTTLALSFDSWQESNVMCAQSLTPFSYLYTELSEDQLATIEKVTIDGRDFYLMSPENN